MTWQNHLLDVTGVWTQDIHPIAQMDTWQGNINCTRQDI